MLTTLLEKATGANSSSPDSRIKRQRDRRVFPGER
jgi:hypothetical protein